MTKPVFDNFIVETAENGFLISAFMADDQIPATLYIATDANRMIELMAEFVGAQKPGKPSATVVKMEPRK